MYLENSVARKRIDLSIGDSQAFEEAQLIPLASHSDLCSELLKNPALKGWERLFVTTLQKSRKPGKKQIAKVEAIASRLGYSLTKEGGER